MSLPRASNRRGSDSDHTTNKVDLDKKKNVSKHSGTKNGTHGKTETRRRASIAGHTKSESKSDTKKHTSVDLHTKSTHASKFYKLSEIDFFLFNTISLNIIIKYFIEKNFLL